MPFGLIPLAQGTEALSVEGLVKSLVRLEVEKVEQGFRDRIEAIEVCPEVICAINERLIDKQPAAYKWVSTF